MTDNLTVSHFSERLGARFTIDVGAEAPYELELIEARGIRADSDHREPFSVLFRGAKDVVLPQSVYRLERQGDEPLDIFLVPIGPDGEGMRYEAVFS